MHDAAAVSIPDDLSACQALMAQWAATMREQSKKIDVQAHTIDAHMHTIDAHVHTIESHALTIDRLHQQQQELERKHQELELAFAELLQRAFQRRSERYLEDPNQLRMDFGDSDAAADAAEGLATAIQESQAEIVIEQVIPEHTRRRTLRPRKEKLPEHLPRYEVEVAVPEELQHCPLHGERKPIGFDVVETLEFERPKLRVRQTKYPKYACQDQPECGVTSPPRPAGLVEGNRYDTSVAAEVITGKYAYHMPTYREQDYFAGCGWTPCRSTLLNLLAASACVIRPLIEHFKQLAIASGVLGTDDTSVTLLLPKNIPPPVEGDLKSARIHEVFQKAILEQKPSVLARMWAYRSLTVPINVFDFTVSHHRDGPDAFLAGFSGTLLADCYSGYQGIALRSSGVILRAACSSHARRKVFEARDVYPKEASLLLGMFQQLYDIEDRGKTLSVVERQSLREHEAAPVWQSMREWLDGQVAAAVLPKSKLGEALRYLRNHWDPLRVYLSDGR
ncbi:MAG: transposase, partial [Pirellulales bacterium]